MTQLEKRRLRTSSGKLPAPKIVSLAASHPFTQQVDVVFPSNPCLLEALQKLETCYRKGKVRLSDVVNNGFSTTFGGESNLLLVSHSRHEDDVWCIDPRAHLTICASKGSYERLGLVGHKLPFKNQSGYHSIDIPLGKNAHPPKNLEKIKSALLRWDEDRRAESGDESREFWDVLYCVRGPFLLLKPLFLQDPGISPQVLFHIREEEIRKVQCRRREMHNVHIPQISLDGSTNDPDTANDWLQHLRGIFEWVGMACLGAQRLYANDRVDPFVAVYDPPAPFYVGKMTHLQWKGLLSPGFVQRVLDVIINVDSTTSGLSFVGVTSHALTRCPVSYIPSRQAESGEVFHPHAFVPLKLPKEDGEDTWALLLEYPRDSGLDVKWCLMESLGEYDNRWG